MNGISEGIGKAEWSAVLEAVCDLPINATTASNVIAPYNRLRLALVALGGVWDDVAKRSNRERRPRTQIDQYWVIVLGAGAERRYLQPDSSWGVVSTAWHYSTRCLAQAALRPEVEWPGVRIIRVTRYRVQR